MTYTYYDVDLKLLNTIEDTVIEVPVSAGTRTLNCTFKWFTEIQEQYNEYDEMVKMMSQVDPIGTNHNYNYINYYKDIDDIDTWLSEQTELPQSLSNKPHDEQVQLITERIEFSNSVYDAMSTYKELLVWNLEINETYILRLFPGSLLQLDDGTTIQVESKTGKSEINYGDLLDVNLIVGVPND